MVPQIIKIKLLDLAHLIWHLCNRIYFNLICIYYYLLLNFEQAHSNNNNIPVNNHSQDLRIPKHISLAFTNEANCLDLESIARLLCWCKQLSIAYITLYDDNGNLKAKQRELFKQVELRMKSLGCGDKQIHKIEGLQIISKSDGRSKFLDDVKESIQSNTFNSKDINLAKVHNRIGWLSDPELLISFGSTLCLYGFPPWQLRLTEILDVPTHRNLPQRIFIDCLKRYSQTSQREGV